jgi:hypothetical protein
MFVRTRCGCCMFLIYLDRPPAWGDAKDPAIHFDNTWSLLRRILYLKVTGIIIQISIATHIVWH